MEKQGKITTTSINKLEIIIPSEQIREALELDINDKAIFLERLRSSNGTPIMIEKAWFKYDRFKFLLEVDFLKKGLYKTLEEDFNIQINKATETFKATRLTREESELLGSKNAHYGLRVTRTAFSNGEVVSYSSTVSKGDTFEFSIELE